MEDYIKDGILYCGKCNTPKESITHFLGKEYRSKALCKCEQEKYEKFAKSILEENQKIKIDSLRKAGITDKRFLKYTFDRDNTKSHISDVCKRYVANFEELYKAGKGLILYGSVGTGKTFLACCITNALIDKGYNCLITDFAKLERVIFNQSNRDDYIQGLNRFALLVIDDLGAERETDYMLELVDSVIDSRYRSGKPLIVTTNLTGEDLKNPKNIRQQRIYSRLLEMCILLPVNGVDRRKDKFIKDYPKYKELLGI